MTNLTDERLKEMEEEMNRFEEEILTSQNDRGSLESLPKRMRDESYQRSSSTAVRHVKVDVSSAQKTILLAGRVLPPPPPPPPPPAHTDDQTVSRFAAADVRLPIRPSPPTPGFLPPQLRHRPLPSRPLPPQPPPGALVSASMLSAAPMMPLSHMYARPTAAAALSVSAPVGNYRPFQPQLPASAMTARVKYEQPKVVYAAAPVMNAPRVSTALVTSATASSDTVTVKSDLPPSLLPTLTAAAVNACHQPTVGRGIELNVPVVTDKYMSSTSTSKSVNVSSAVPASQQSSVRRDKNKDKKRKFVRMAAGSVWEDTTLGEWDLDDFRLFCGDLGNEVTDDTLTRAFNKYPSFQKARVIRDKRTNKTKGFGFVSFKDPSDFTRAMREMNGRYVGNRPIKLRKSQWRDRQIDNVRKKEREKKRLGFR